MFACAVARPRFKTVDGQRLCTFDGKIGIWPFVERVRAQRSSVNRPAGTWETKPIKVKKDNYRQMMVNKLVPAIRQKWPAEDRRCVVRLQQDNATPHGKMSSDPWIKEWEELCMNAQARVKIQIVEQPANSPDTNVDDLGFFRALQSTYWQQTLATTVEELIASVEKAFREYEPERLN